MEKWKVDYFGGPGPESGPGGRKCMIFSRPSRSGPPGNAASKDLPASDRLRTDPNIELKNARYLRGPGKRNRS